jgi:hypothetical protein
MKGGAARVVAAFVALALAPVPGAAQSGGVESTVHNLSVTGPGEIRALDETEVCKFCHIPHNASAPSALWSRRLSSVDYQTPSIRTPQGDRITGPQPDGSSRLCLSCHDGTIALGEIAGEPRRIAMAGTPRLGPGRRGFLGTDLSGSHPISFVVPDGDYGTSDTDRDMGLKSLNVIHASPEVRLDAEGKMQCTTCHDPHRDNYYRQGFVPRFWVLPTVEEVCLTCHDLR